MKKTWLTLISVILAVAMLAGCSSKTPSSSTAPGESEKSSGASKGQITLTLYDDLLTTRGSNNEPVVKEIEKRLLADRGLNVKLNFIGSSHDQAFQTINMKLAANELDGFSMYQEGTLTNDFMTKGLVLGLDEYLAEFPHIASKVPDAVWYNGMLDGKKYMFPIPPALQASIYPWIRKDLLDKVGLPLPKTLDEFAEAIKKIKATDKNLLGYSAQHTGWIFTQTLGMGYDPNEAIKDGVVQLNVQQGLGGAALPESPYYRSWLSKMQQFYKDGVINQEVFTMKGDQMPDLINSGRLIAMANGFGFQRTADRLAGVDPLNPLPADAKKQDWAMIPLENEGKPLTWSYGPTAAAFIGIAKNSKHPKEVLTVLDWMAENIDNYTLAQFGIEGTNYDRKDDIIIPRVTTGSVPIYDAALGRFAGDIWGETVIKMTSSYIGTEWKKALDPNVKKWHGADADVSYSLTKSKSLLPNIEQIGHEFFVNAVSGQIELNDAAYTKLIDELNKAGVKEVMDETNEQYKAAKAKK